MSKWIACPSCGGQRRQRREEEWDDVLALTIIANGKAAEHIAYLTARHAALVAAAEERAETGHDINCRALMDSPGRPHRCDCGYAALRAALDGEPR